VKKGFNVYYKKIQERREGEEEEQEEAQL